MHLDRRVRILLLLLHLLSPNEALTQDEQRVPQALSTIELPFPDELYTFDRSHRAVFCDHPRQARERIDRLFACSSRAEFARTYDFKFALEIVEIRLGRLFCCFRFLVVSLEREKKKKNGRKRHGVILIQTIAGLDFFPLLTIVH